MTLDTQTISRRSGSSRFSAPPAVHSPHNPSPAACASRLMPRARRRPAQGTTVPRGTETLCRICAAAWSGRRRGCWWDVGMALRPNETKWSRQRHKPPIRRAGVALRPARRSAAVSNQVRGNANHQVQAGSPAQLMVATKSSSLRCGYWR